MALFMLGTWVGRKMYDSRTCHKNYQKGKWLYLIWIPDFANYLFLLYYTFILLLFIYEIKLQLVRKLIKRSCYVMVQFLTLKLDLTFSRNSWSEWSEKLVIKEYREIKPDSQMDSFSLPLSITHKHKSSPLMIYSGIMQVYIYTSDGMS